MFASPSTFLLALANLIAQWRAAPQVRRWLRISNLLFLAVFVWSVAYLIPVQDLVKGEAGAKLPVAQLESMLRNITWLNYIRQAMLVAAFGLALHAFGMAYRISGGPARTSASA